jgi:hypothetical protein
LFSNPFHSLILEIAAKAKAAHRRLHARRVRLRVRPRANPWKATRRPKATMFHFD